MISAWDVDSIYKIPMMLHEQMLDEIVCHKLQILARAADLSAWKQDRRRAWSIREHEVDIAFVGKYVDLQDSYKSLNEALHHAGIHTAAGSTSTTSIPRRSRRQRRRQPARRWTRSWCRAASASAAPRARSRAIRYARENGVPYLGICLGMQLATIEFARNVCGLAGANSTEFDPDTPHPVVALITEWLDRTGRIERRNEPVRPRRHDAPGRAEVPGGAGHPGCVRSTAPRSTNATATATR